jgi:hypothetical protein
VALRGYRRLLHPARYPISASPVDGEATRQQDCSALSVAHLFEVLPTAERASHTAANTATAILPVIRRYFLPAK